jgi:hypothetical protein
MPAAAARRRLPADAAARATVPGEPRRARAVIAPCAPGPPAGVGAARSRVPGPLPPGERGPPPPPPADASRCPRRDRRRHCRVCGWSPRGAWAPGAGWGAVSASRRPAGAAQPARRTWREAAHSWAGGAQGPSARRATPHPVGPAFCPGGCAAPAQSRCRPRPCQPGRDSAVAHPPPAVHGHPRTVGRGAPGSPGAPRLRGRRKLAHRRPPLPVARYTAQTRGQPGLGDVQTTPHGLCHRQCGPLRRCVTPPPARDSGALATHGLCLRGIAQRDWGGCRTPARPMA